MEVDYKKIGQEIRKYRLRKQMSQCELAELIKVSPKHLSHIENGVRRASFDVIFAIATVFNKPVDAFLVGQGNNYIMQYTSEYSDLLSDCSKYECQVIIDVSYGVKRALRNNTRYLNNSRKK